MNGRSPWRGLLLPLTPLYRGAVAARLAAYRRGWLRSSRLPAPVVSVGNLTFGGTGKTPTVIAIVRDLVRRGRRPAVLTRGFGRSGAEPLVLVGPDPGITADAAGDEPLEIASRLPGIPVVVDADRVRGGIVALKNGADILVLDDGFQHLRLERDLDLVLVDAGDPWGGDRLPPRGRLREPVAHVARASAVLVTKVSGGDDPMIGRVRRRVEQVAPDCTVLAARLEIVSVRRGGELADPCVLRGQRVLATAGLGRPGGFAEVLGKAGSEVVEHRWFPDHHPWPASDVEAVVGRANELDAIVATTAKDAVKMPDDAEVWVVEVVMSPMAGDWDELWRLMGPGGS